MSGIRPPSFDTIFMTLGTDPVDLAVDDRLLPWPPDVAGWTEDDPAYFEYATREVFIQCTAGAARWRESDAAPASDAEGHLLERGDGVVVSITRRARSGRGFWIWRGTVGTKIAISPAAPSPSRDATLDVPVEPDTS